MAPAILIEQLSEKMTIVISRPMLLLNVSFVTNGKMLVLQIENDQVKGLV